MLVGMTQLPKPTDTDTTEQPTDQQPELTLPAVRQKIRDAEIASALRTVAFGWRALKENRQALGRLRPNNHGKR